ncbi:MAG: ABC transporter ATP-binding protein [Burkholderiaceae bacterium]
MRLELNGIGRSVGGQVHLYPMDLALAPGAVTVLLGATLAGKTSLMRIIAGLDAPTQGRVVVDGRDVTGVPVRERGVSMVYQQFINYPSMTVFDNIASPLRLAKAPDIAQRVRALAARLHIDHLLDRLPSQLSGGQQQRVALARALAKGAPLMLLDEPLVNLDYKLREELREELGNLFADGDSTVVYATTEPGEALLMGGHTAVLREGRLLQYGPTVDVFLRPASIDVARAFSDPPMNLVAGRADGGTIRVSPTIAFDAPVRVAGDVTVGIRASHLDVEPRPGDVTLPAVVDLAEMSGSDTFLYARTELGEIVAQFTGVRRFELGQRVDLHVSPRALHVFGDDGRLIQAPPEGG